MYWRKFPLQIFPQICFWLKDFTKIVRLFLASVSVNVLRVPLEIVVWIYDTFYDDFAIENDCMKYLKESCL